MDNEKLERIIGAEEFKKLKARPKDELILLAAILQQRINVAIDDQDELYQKTINQESLIVELRSNLNQAKSVIKAMIERWID